MSIIVPIEPRDMSSTQNILSSIQLHDRPTISQIQNFLFVEIGTVLANGWMVSLVHLHGILPVGHDVPNGDGCGKLQCFRCLILPYFLHQRWGSNIGFEGVSGESHWFS
jgi:hypothetical protein